MKIGIITSGNDTLTLFKFLQKHDHEYVIYYDFLNHSYGDKTFEYSFSEIKKGIGFLIKQGCEKIILPPVYELACVSLDKGKGTLWGRDLLTASEKRPKNLIFPLFKTYLQNYCFSQSLVGKLGVFGDHADIQIAQKIINEESKKYVLTENQKNIKKFHFPFNFRSKEIPLRKHFLESISYAEPIINTTIKYDLRYFKDAGIDTAIPLNYGYFNYQKTISKFFNFKKTRFHKIENLEEIFSNYCEESKNQLLGVNKANKEEYSVSVFYTNHCNFLLRNKKLLRLLQRGKTTKVKYEEVK